MSRPRLDAAQLELEPLCALCWVRLAPDTVPAWVRVATPVGPRRLCRLCCAAVEDAIRARAAAHES